MDDANGGIGDELDGISLRDVSAVRYVRHHEWLELVVGTAIPTHQIQIPKIFSPIDSNNTTPWSFSDPESVKAKLESIEKEIEDYEKQSKTGWVTDETENSKSDFYRKAITKLREDFGSISQDENYTENLVKEIEEKFGSRIVEKKRLRRVGVNVQDEEEEEDDDENDEGEEEEGGEEEEEGEYNDENEKNLKMGEDKLLAGNENTIVSEAPVSTQSNTANNGALPDLSQIQNTDSITQPVVEDHISTTVDSNPAEDSANLDDSSLANQDLLSLQDDNMLLDNDDLGLDGGDQDIYMEGTSFDDARLGEVLGELPES